MIQCVESRTEEHPYCSRVCCSQALKNAIMLKRRDPESNVIILYRDIRSYGFRERYYREARGLGVLFVRYELESPPVVERRDGRLFVRAFDAGIQDTLTIEADTLVLSVGSGSSLKRT